MGWKATWVSAVLAATAQSLAAPSTHVLLEERDDIPARWIKLGRVPSHMKLPVRVGLAQTNLHLGHDYLMHVSEPDSASYGKYWTAEQVIEAFKPSDSTMKAVTDWLVQSGISSERIARSENQAWLAFDATAAEMESLLYTEFNEYRDRKTGGIMPSCDRYYVPKSVQGHIDYITPGIKLLAPAQEPKNHEKQSFSEASAGELEHKARSSPYRRRSRHYKPDSALPDNSATNLSTCDVTITPACIRALYELPFHHKAAPNNSIGIFESYLEYWDQTDLNLFFANLSNFIPQGTHPKNYLIDGAVAIAPNLSVAGGEAMLDLSVSYPIVYPQNVTVWNDDDIHYQSWPNDTYTFGFNTWLDAIDGSYCEYCAFGECGDAPGIDPKYPDPGPGGYSGKLRCGGFKSTNVVSLSYGGQEADVPIAYQKRQCNEYLKLGLQGVSFFFGSGDDGVGNNPPPVGDGCLGPKSDIFSPFWPANCPYVTSVGATKVYPGHTVYQPESGAYDPKHEPYRYKYSSGGGFSNVYPVPSYQKDAVATFFKDHEPPYKYYTKLASNAPNPQKVNAVALAGNTDGVYNRKGRGIPDVSANGANVAIYLRGEYRQAAGTSESTILFASIINRINDERILAGKGPVGFINPTLYRHPYVLNDVTNGTNPACHSDGFNASRGWDPVTGLGTPNYPKMLKLFMSLP